METLIARIETLFAQRGGSAHDASIDRAPTPLACALQCAQLAEWSGADAALVAAALLHGVGTLAGDGAGDAGERAVQWLGDDALPRDVLEPIRLQVPARRYLAATEPRRAAAAGDGVAPLTEAEVQAFEAEPYAADAVQLARWIEQACEPGKRTPTIDYYLQLLDEVLARPELESKMGIGPISVV